MSAPPDPPLARIELLGGHEGRRVRLQGWLYNRRSSSKLHFLQVRDGTGIVQCVVARADVPPEVFQKAGELELALGAYRQAIPRGPFSYPSRMEALVKRLEKRLQTSQRASGSSA